MSENKHTKAIFGGTFNPVHSGHLHLAKTCQAAFNFDQFLILPNSIPAYKKQPIDAHHRIAMLNLVFDELSAETGTEFVIDERELKRDGYTYTIDTVRELRKELGEAVSLTFLMGADSFAQFDTWEGWQEILEHVHLLIVNRPGSEDWQTNLSPDLKAFYAARATVDAQQVQNESAGLIFHCQMQPVDVSSSAIRKAFAEGAQIAEQWLHISVKNYVEQNQLYYKPNLGG